MPKQPSFVVPSLCIAGYLGRSRDVTIVETMPASYATAMSSRSKGVALLSCYNPFVYGGAYTKGYTMSVSVAAKIYPTRALQTNLRELKSIADNDLVHITENGSAAYVFCSEEVLQRTVDHAVEDELYRRRLADVLASGEADLAAGNVVVGIDAAFDEADRLAASHG